MKKILFLMFAFLCVSCSKATITSPLDALKSLEGIVLKDGRCVTYDDATGKACKRKADGTWDCKGTPTIGYGETSEAIVGKGAITVKEAENLLQERINDLTSVIDANVKVSLTQGQKTALICFAYNIGVSNFKSSTLLKVLNEGKYNEVPVQMMRWVYSKGKVSKGLRNRRQKEIVIWNS